MTPRIERLINEQASTQDIKREALNRWHADPPRNMGSKRLPEGIPLWKAFYPTDERPIFNRNLDRK